MHGSKMNDCCRFAAFQPCGDFKVLQNRTFSCALINLGLSLAGTCYALWYCSKTHKLDFLAHAAMQSRHDVDSQKLMLALEHGTLQIALQPMCANAESIIQCNILQDLYMPRRMASLLGFTPSCLLWCPLPRSSTFLEKHLGSASPLAQEHCFS